MGSKFCTLDARPDCAYVYSVQIVEPTWQTSHLATSIHRVETTTSTQDDARRLIAAGQGDGVIVIAVEQREGRGRFGREWHSPAGNLYMSLVIKPPQPLPFWPQYTMLAALVVAGAVESVPAGPVDLKWPNDVLLAGRKVAGILAEVAGSYLILGIGLNVNAPVSEWAANATTLCDATGGPLDIAALTKSIVEELDVGFGRALHGAQFHHQWAARLQTLGRHVRVKVGNGLVNGLAECVTSEGALILRKSDGRSEAFLAGDVAIDSTAAP
jgi:BirA family biotin operon repressor/biotin-[acetyl-CoA-carboxylase] ligase